MTTESHRRRQCIRRRDDLRPSYWYGFTSPNRDVKGLAGIEVFNTSATSDAYNMQVGRVEQRRNLHPAVAVDVPIGCDLFMGWTMVMTNDH